MSIILFGYIRTSSQGQNHSRQMVALKGFCPELDNKNIYIDQASGENFDRPQYHELKKVLRLSDTLIVSSLDRFGRNKELIKKELIELRELGVNVQILDLPTTLVTINEGNEWILEMVSNILIEVLGAVSENERNLIARRQKEGIALAKLLPGKYIGRPKSELPKDFPKLYKKWKSNGITGTQFAVLLGYKSRSTLYKKIKQYELEHYGETRSKTNK